MAKLGIMSAEGWLETIRGDLPRTVAMAIDFVKALGERFIWVDPLCIAYDSRSEMGLCERMMTSVYRGAYFTLFTAAEDADGGLAGSGPGGQGRGDAQPPAATDINWILSHSTFSQSGWALGELVLSPRIIVLVGGRHMSFSCQTSQQSDKTSEVSPPFKLRSRRGTDLSVPAPLSGFLPFISPYMDLTEEYSRREKRDVDDADTLRAFGGLNHALTAGLTGQQIQGIPDYLVDAFLLFVPTGKLRRRPGFPSYSWAGWEGEFRWPRETFVDAGAKVEHDDAWRIAWWMEHSTYIDWRPARSREEWRGFDCSSDEDVPLTKYIKERPGVYPTQIAEAVCSSTDLDPETHKAASFVTWSSWRKAGMWNRLRGPLDNLFNQWENEDSAAAVTQAAGSKHGADAPRIFEMYEFNAVNSKSEFCKLASQVLPHYERMLTTWVAGRRAMYRERQKSDSQRESTGVDSGPGDGGYADDERALPYPLIRAPAIRLSLTLGEPLRRIGKDEPAGLNSQTATVPAAYPLYSRSGKLVGSLHPDNISCVIAAASKPAIDLVVMSLSQAPTAGSVFYEDPTLLSTASETRNLLWVLHVEYGVGEVAERRGIGQILVSALADALDEGPVVSWVKLG
ncbi:hypothetical protein MAPG_06912 [Magnaporthiopsis poae ATCC 64411]|uniref:Heterokaryon incompatibility domain-containing protein n=1 Tax=Magnaporthiopsis poae (strain ATCC 64411 / 73-15) TaxID=644358 RepID=A0A0C4E3B5_MAGP6|nr:hypothetical protein MAPG_06912 [Magnaporthiopsis poae ATCC 64411]